MKLFPYQARKAVKKRDIIMTRICTCHKDFKPIKITSEKSDKKILPL